MEQQWVGVQSAHFFSRRPWLKSRYLFSFGRYIEWCCLRIHLSGCWMTQSNVSDQKLAYPYYLMFIWFTVDHILMKPPTISIQHVDGLAISLLANSCQLLMSILIWGHHSKLMCPIPDSSSFVFNTKPRRLRGDAKKGARTRMSKLPCTMKPLWSWTTSSERITIWMYTKKIATSPVGKRVQPVMQWMRQQWSSQI